MPKLNECIKLQCKTISTLIYGDRKVNSKPRQTAGVSELDAGLCLSTSAGRFPEPPIKFVNVANTNASRHLDDIILEN